MNYVACFSLMLIVAGIQYAFWKPFPIQQRIVQVIEIGPDHPPKYYVVYENNR